MSKRLMTLLGGHRGRYPYQLAKRFPHVVETLGLLWGQAEILRYFDKLLLSDRADRHGFPPEVMSELLELRGLHDELFPKFRQGADVWSFGPTR